MFKEYVEYFKNNPEGYWFKAKLFGWGWTPVKWQGWASLLIFIAVVVWDFERIDLASHSNSDTLRPFLLQFALMLIVFALLTKGKWEKPRWSWGPPKKK